MQRSLLCKKFSSLNILHMFNCVLTFCKPNNNVIISSCRCVIDVIVNSAYQIKATVKMQNMLSFNFLNSKSKINH